MAVDTVRFVRDPVAVVATVIATWRATRSRLSSPTTRCRWPSIRPAMTGRPAILLHTEFPTNVALDPLPSGTGVGHRRGIDDYGRRGRGLRDRAADGESAAGAVLDRGAPGGGELRAGRPGADHLVVPQTPHLLHTFLARKLGPGEDRMRAIAPGRGRRLRRKINIYGDEHVAAALSKRLSLLNK